MSAPGRSQALIPERFKREGTPVSAARGRSQPPAPEHLVREGASFARASASVHLLDGNVLVALATPSHVHHGSARTWFASGHAPFATCPITQGTLLRLLMRLGGLPAQAAMEVLAGFTQHPRHRYWADDVDYATVGWNGVLGHRQVTDAYLAQLARSKQGRLVTFDGGLAALHADVAVALQAS